MKRFFIALPLILPALFLLHGCGLSGYDETQIKDYRIYVENGDAEMNQLFEELIEQYNRDLGFVALQFTRKPEDANSTIRITKGLQQRDGKVGWGQWSRDVENGSFSLDTRPDRTVVYSMQLEFDQDFIQNNKNLSDPKQNYEIFKLLAHEAGHGFTQNHIEENQRAVMYPDISGEKEFSPYYNTVRNFFGVN